MPILSDYNHFEGRHPETGSVQNILAYQGVSAPHTGKPYTEAFLLGVSGGIAFGYFTFDYEGYDPILALLTRNTFDPLQTMLERLGVRQTVVQTSQPKTGEQNLKEVLANGCPALIWVDVFSMPYHGLPQDEKNWEMHPVVIYGLEAGAAYLAGGSEQPLQVSQDTLSRARARVKKEKFRVVTLDPPDERKLAAAVQAGIAQCIRLYTEKPPKGGRDNFGFAALEKWSNLLTNTRNPQGWERFFPCGPRLFAALAGNAFLPGAYGWIKTWGTRPDADRSTYADFLDEAAVILQKPDLQKAGDLFRKSGELWLALADRLLPEDTPLLSEARRLKDTRRKLFIEQGHVAEEEIREINIRLNFLRKEAQKNFPLDETASAAMRSELRDQVQMILEQEKKAIGALQEMMV